MAGSRDCLFGSSPYWDRHDGPQCCVALFWPTTSKQPRPKSFGWLMPIRWFSRASCQALGHCLTELAIARCSWRGLLVFGGSSTIAAFTPNPTLLIAARAVLALGAAMMLPATISIIRVVFVEDQQRAIAIGIWGSVFGRRGSLGTNTGWFPDRAFLVGSCFPYQRSGRSAHARSDLLPHSAIAG